jgi:mono/diheme cytochrome c family protein
MTYPLRGDTELAASVIVREAPPADPKHFERPGQWPYLLPIFDETNGKKFDPNKLPGEKRSRLAKFLSEQFGTPAKPTVKGIDDEAKKKLKLEDDTLANGSKLYRRHCLHCHGLTGDGHGPTAPWVNPHPRDYRAGLFKFTSTMGGKERKPSRDDLTRTLKQGIEGTSMPSFGLLPENELNDIISYVIHLSIRGNLEYQMIRYIFSDVESTEEEALSEIVDQWTKAQNDPIPVFQPPIPVKDLKDPDSPELKESIRRGHQVFLQKEGKCMECHVDYGRQLAYKYDDWGTIVRPRDVTAGVMRGGRRPIDIYFRLFNGINGTPMPKFVSVGKGQEPDSQKMQQVWDLINFIQAAPYPGMLPEDVRDAMYERKKTGNVRAEASIR